MSTIELDVKLNNLLYVLNQLRTGRDAIRFGRGMSIADKTTLDGARMIAQKTLAMEYQNAGDDELITGMETYIATYMETKHAAIAQK
jgi:hypothetical protein